jgi:HEPN domain-containing protein
MDGGTPQGNTKPSSQYLLIAMRYECLALDLLTREQKLDAELLDPARFLMVHAVEMYLLSWLAHHNASIDKSHDFKTKVENATQVGLKLKNKTYAHILTLRKEYNFLRYGANEAMPIPPLSRLQATLREVSQKVLSVLSPPIA